ncbi:MAG: 1-acyl-sn-glycerol-3-phosphate acyltransferase [Spirochaetales bacterium]|nr:1-acyl-sn-glycerol-3-phosphate acyltransferase [Spirochaetales bacterium]
MVFLRVILYILLAMFALIMLWFLPCFFYSLPIKNRVYRKSHAFARFMARITCWGAFFFTRSHVRLVGKEKLPKDTRFVYVANHVSRFDPMVILYKMAAYRIGFISKPSNFRIPFFGKIIRKMCFLEIDRENPKKALETVSAAVDILRSGEASIGLYPEGTRSKDGKLGPFHGFMFRIPKQAEVPVVVAVTRGTEEVAKRFPFPGGAKIEIKIVDVLDVEYIRSHRPVEISERVEALIRNELGQ